MYSIVANEDEFYMHGLLPNRSALEQRIAAESMEKRNTHLQQLRSAQKQDCCGIDRGEGGPTSTAKVCSGTENCFRINEGERDSSSTAKDCSGTEDCCGINRGERGARLYQK